MGLTLGHDGLTLRMRDGTHMFANITLTRDYDQALSFLGYDPSVFANGFDALSDIFAYVASSPFFNPDIFLLENRNNASRTRDRKRPTYTAFLAYCQQNAHTLTKFPFPANKADWLPRMAQHFPQFQAQYNLELARLDQQRAVKAKFNGEWVSQITGLQGKELGGLMKRFKESFESDEAQRDYVLCTSLADIEARVRQVQAEMYG